jgi:hypothetical protein
MNPTLNFNIGHTLRDVNLNLNFAHELARGGAGAAGEGTGENLHLRFISWRLHRYRNNLVKYYSSKSNIYFNVDGIIKVKIKGQT